MAILTTSSGEAYQISGRRLGRPRGPGGLPFPWLRPLLRKVLAETTAGCSSIHGPDHWTRVAWNAVLLARESGGDTRVAALFGMLHDCMRVHDGADPWHGRRAAGYAMSLKGRWPALPPGRLALLRLAISRHSRGETSRDPTVGACWDADRLDLARLGVVPSPRFLSTRAARLIARAQGSLRGRPDPAIPGAPVLYHGSSVKTAILRPSLAFDTRHAEGRRFGVYATPSRDLALAFALGAVPDEAGRCARMTTAEDPARMVFVHGRPDFGGKGYLYTLPARGFVHVGGGQWVCARPVRPVEVLEISVDDHLDRFRYATRAEAAACGRSTRHDFKVVKEARS